MQEYSFATLVAADEARPIATHLPFVVEERGDELFLLSHVAKANDHWKTFGRSVALVIFNEPHAYISPKHYHELQSVPTWNYVAVHAYGNARILTEAAQGFAVLDKMMLTYEPEYKQQRDALSADYKSKMFNGIVAFEICVDALQAKEKLSQKDTDTVRANIVKALGASSNPLERDIAERMKKI